MRKTLSASWRTNIPNLSSTPIFKIANTPDGQPATPTFRIILPSLIPHAGNTHFFRWCVSKVLITSHWHFWFKVSAKTEMTGNLTASFRLMSWYLATWPNRKTGEPDGQGLKANFSGTACCFKSWTEIRPIKKSAPPPVQAHRAGAFSKAAPEKAAATEASSGGELISRAACDDQLVMWFHTDFQQILGHWLYPTFGLLIHAAELAPPPWDTLTFVAGHVGFPKIICLPTEKSSTFLRC